MADECFRHPRLATVYDLLDPHRADLAPYLRMAEESGVRRVLDLGCGTGVFALMLAERGFEAVGVDPALASLDVARGKPGSERVRWIHGDVTTLPPDEGADLVTMTGNAAQEIVGPVEWRSTLRGARAALRPGGHLVFETRIPARRAWEEWNRQATYAETDVPGAGVVAYWIDLLDVSGPLVTFRQSYVFTVTGEVLTSESTLRFRERPEVEAELLAQGYELEDVREAPDRPGREFVFVARAGAGA